MPANMIDVAKSALLTYRTALTVTGENVANVNTEGYRRRDVTTQTLGGAATLATTVPTGGQGVQVADIRRAFDGFLAERLRDAGSDTAAAQALADTAHALEDTLAPSAGGIDSALTTMFSALNQLSGAPANLSLRKAVLNGFSTLAGTISGMAQGLETLRDGVVSQAKSVTQDVNANLQSLWGLQLRYAANTGAAGVLNPLSDERDRLLSSIAEKLGVTADLDILGRATITLGDGGPTLMTPESAGVLSVAGTRDLTLTITRNGASRDTRMLTSGTLGGYAQALGAIDDAIEELDALARKITAEMNAAHRAGLDLSDAAGGDLFTMDGWQAVPAVGNQGHVAVMVTNTDTSGATNQAVTLTYDGAAGLWRATDGAGTELATGATLVTLPTATVTLEGDPQDGDRISLTPTTGRAADMRMLISDPRLLAAAGAVLVAASPDNSGTATLSLTPTTNTPPALDTLADVLGADAGASSPLTLIGAGVVGYIPAGTSSATLATLGKQASAQITLASAAAASGLTALTVTPSGGGGAQVFDLTRLADGSLRPAGWGLPDIAAALNDGRLITLGGATAGSLGLQAAATATGLTLVRAGGNFASVTATGGSGTLTATLTAGQAAGGQIQIFTREGRQIAGPALTASQAAALLTTANGFFAGAEYRTDSLDGAGNVTYRGMGLSLDTSGGLQTLRLAATVPQGWSGTGEPALQAAASYSLDDATGASASVTVPAGASAALMAERMSRALPGLRAEARTDVSLTASADGHVTFSLMGTNATPVALDADISGGRLDDVAAAINGVTAATGITAALSPKGDRLILSSATGADVRLTGFTHSAGGTIALIPVDATGVAQAATVTLGAGMDSARLAGQITLSGESRFAATLGGVRRDSAADPLVGSLVTSTALDAGAVRRYDFDLDAAVDVPGAGLDGLSAVAAPTTYSVTLGGKTVSIDTGAAGASTAAGVAVALANALRAGQPQPALTGAALASLPPEGTSASVVLDGQSYTLRMTGGQVAVSGGQPGRLTAAYDASNRLVLTVAGGSTAGAFAVLGQGDGATAFGLQAGSRTLTGAVPQGPYPATLTVDIGGTQHALGVTAGPNVTLPAGFPGTVSVAANGAITLSLPAQSGAARVINDAGAQAAGFANLGAEVAADGATLRATSADGSVLSTTARATSLASQRVTLTNLPPEDLIVVMAGSGNLTMAGRLGASGGSTARQGTMELRVTDAASGRVEMFDKATGTSIATRVLGSTGRATMAGYGITLSGKPALGDTFTLTANTSGANDGRALDGLMQLQSADSDTGLGGFAAVLAQVQTTLGARAQAADTRLTGASAAKDSLAKVDSAQGGVDLDTEAAKLVEYQQAYQASAQVMSMARELFNTLLQSLS